FEVPLEIERTRRARIEEHDRVAEWILLGDRRRADREHGEVVVTQRRGGVRARAREDEIARWSRVLEVHSFGGCRSVREMHARREPRQRARARKRDERCLPSRDLLRIAENELLFLSRPDREHARRKLVARALLEQRRILLPVQEVFVGAPRLLQLDDLALLELLADAHREATHA